MTIEFQRPQIDAYSSNKNLINYIAIGQDNQILNSKSCSIIGGKNNTINLKSNCHVVGDSADKFMNLLDDSFNVSCMNGIHCVGDITAFAGSANPASISSLAKLIKIDNTNNLIGLGLVPDLNDTYGGSVNYTAQIKESVRVVATDKTAKLKLVSTSTTNTAGASISLVSERHENNNLGNYSIFIGGSSGYFNIKNELANYSIIHSNVSGTWSFYPVAPDGSSGQNDQDLGTSAFRWNDVWSKQSALNSSDENLKQDIEDLSEAENRVAVKCKGLIKKYRWKESVVSKGENARIHIGIIAQELKAAFESEGLDAHKYGMFGEDTWYEGLDSEGEPERVYEPKEGYTETTQLSVRYNELLAFIISAL